VSDGSKETGVTAALTMAELVVNGATLNGDKIAVIVDDASITYDRLAELVGEVEAYLVEELQVQPGEKIATLMTNSIDAAVWFLAVGSLGCTVVPLNTRLRQQELAFQVSNSDSAVVVARESDMLQALEEAIVQEGQLSTELPELRAVVNSSGQSVPWAVDYRAGLALENEPPRAEPDDVLLMQYTSGTTAFPKGVLLSHRQIITNARGVAARLGVSEADKVCSPSPFFHCAGSTLTLTLGLASNATVVTTGRFNPERTLDLIEREQVTIYSGIETFFLGLMTDPAFHHDRIASIRTGWIAAPVEILAQIHEQMGLTGIVNVYGLSEASPNVCISRPTGSREQRLTCGKPHSGMQIRIVGSDRSSELPRGETGIIQVKGPCVTRGYHRNEEATRETIDEDGWLHTGDLGRIDMNGDLIYGGRSKDMLRVGGENVAPAEIEAALLTHPEVGEIAVIGSPHPKLVEVPVAFVVPREGTHPDPRVLTAFAAGLLASFKVPREVVIVDALPKTGSGKIQKIRLKELLGT
jgi:acyl-CoA synthetase (AMP-forming)/AMP-acid ligase II